MTGREMRQRTGFVNVSELAARVGMPIPTLHLWITREFVAAPTHRLTGGKRLHYTEAEAREIAAKIEK